MRTTCYEDGEENSKRRVIEVVLQARFGPLSPTVRQRIADYPAEKLEDLVDAVYVAKSLKELGFED